MKNKSLSLRWVYLAVGVIALLFAGVIYAWSILKTPLAEAFAWSGSRLALNFTLTMCFFCLGGFVGGLISKRLGSRASLCIAAALSCAGFVLTSRLSGQSVAMLYVSYGIMAGLGIGIAYNVIISTVCAWFPDKKGLCSGVLMMGFGASALVVGKLASALIERTGWRSAYLSVGIALAVVLVLAALVLRRPGEDDTLPQSEKKTASAGGEDFEVQDLTTAHMLRRLSFWLAFLCIVCMSAVGNTVISFARDLALSVRLGRKKTMLLANLLTILAAGITLIAVSVASLPLCVLGLCLTGFSYGAGPTISSAFTSAFYGTKYFPVNFSVMNFNLMFASFMATAASGLLEATGGYVGPFVFLLGLAVVSLVLNLSIKRP